MEIFKLYGYDCMFGGINYLGRLALVTTVPMLVVFIFTVPWLASFFYQKHRRSLVFDTCANSVMWVIYLIYPLLCLMTIQGFKCVNVEDLHLLAADMKEPCPWKEGERGSWIFVWSVASMLLYPIGIPVILLACLLRLDLPRLSRYGKGEAIFEQLIGLYIKQRDESVCSRIATYVGGSKDETQPQADLAERAAQLHREVSGNGEHAVTSERFINFIMTKDVTDDDREEMEQIFAHFDDDGNGALDEEEMLKLLTFLIDANSRIHVGLTLRTVKTMDLKTMTNHFLMDWERAQSSGLTRLFLKQLTQEADSVPVQRRASLLESSSFRSQGSSSRQSSSSMAGAGEVADTDITEKDKIIDSLLVEGRKMIWQGVFALPKLTWNTNQAHPEEKRVLAMIGFLLDAYHKEAWWWELFEMWRKFMLAGAIILIPTEGGKQIAFALLISTICLYTSLRTSPYIIENLLKLHIMSLTAQCITLFYALLLEIQDVTSVAEVCEHGQACHQQNLSDKIMESLLLLLQVSVFVMPVFLLLRDKGVFNAVGFKFARSIGEVRTRLGVGSTTFDSTTNPRWPSEFTSEESASTSPLHSQKKAQNKSVDVTYSQTARRAAVGIGGGVGGDSRTAARSQSRLEDEGFDFKVEVADSTNITGDNMPSLSDGQAARRQAGETSRHDEMLTKVAPRNGATRAEHTAGERDVEMNVFRLFPDSGQLAAGHDVPLATLGMNKRSNRSGDVSAGGSGSSDEEEDTAMVLGASIFSRRSGAGADMAASSPEQILNRVDMESSTAPESIQAVLTLAGTSTPAAAALAPVGGMLCSNGCSGMDDAEATHWCCLLIILCRSYISV